jgi:hypothetical protein
MVPQNAGAMFQHRSIVKQVASINDSVNPQVAPNFPVTPVWYMRNSANIEREAILDENRHPRLEMDDATSKASCTAPGIAATWGRAEEWPYKVLPSNDSMLRSTRLFGYEFLRTGQKAMNRSQQVLWLSFPALLRFL